MNPLAAAALRQLPPGAIAAAVLSLQISTMYQVDQVDRRLALLEARTASLNCGVESRNPARLSDKVNDHAPAR